jgi:hypothetical protein
MRIKPLSVKLRAFSCPQGRCRMDHAEQFWFNLESLEENPAQNHPTFTSPV